MEREEPRRMISDTSNCMGRSGQLTVYTTT